MKQIYWRLTPLKPRGGRTYYALDEVIERFGPQKHPPFHVMPDGDGPVKPPYVIRSEVDGRNRVAAWVSRGRSLTQAFTERLSPPAPRAFDG